MSKAVAIGQFREDELWVHVRPFHAIDNQNFHRRSCQFQFQAEQLSRAKCVARQSPSFEVLVPFVKDSRPSPMGRLRAGGKQFRNLRWTAMVNSKDRSRKPKHRARL
jgi:hypothetical protein